MSETTTPTPTPAEVAAAPQEPAAAAPVVADEHLGEAGKAALDSERKARRDADRLAKELAAKLKEYEDRDKTEAQKQADAIQAAKAELDAARAEAARYRAAAKFGLTEDDLALLDGVPGDQLEERAAKLAARLAPVKLPAAPPASGQGNVGQPVNSGKTQLTRDDMKRMSADEIVAAKAEGRFNVLLGIN